MKHVFALYSDSAKAEQAVSMLKENGFDVDKARIHSRQTIEDSTDITAMPAANAGSAPGGGGFGTASGTGSGTAAPVGAVLKDETIEGYLAGIGVDGAEYAFYTRGVKGNGLIVGIDVENKEAERASEILKKAGGRVPQIE